MKGCSIWRDRTEKINLSMAMVMLTVKAILMPFPENVTESIFI